MKTTTSFFTLVLVASLAGAAEQTPREGLLSASKNLAGKANYSWKLTVEEPGRPTGTIEGKREKDGTTLLALARGDQSFNAVLKGSKAAIKTDEGWKSAAEVATDASESGPARFVATLLRNFKAPSDEVEDLAGKTKDLKLIDGSYVGTLMEDAAKDLFFFHIRSDPNGPQLRDAKGSIKIWIEDVISKYEYTIEGTVSSDGNDHEMKRTYTLEIKDVDTTKVSIPAEAAKMLKS